MAAKGKKKGKKRKVQYRAPAALRRRARELGFDPSKINMVFDSKGRPVAAPGSFTPFKAPTSPPPGTYDPALDSELRASGRGLEDLLADYDTGVVRREDDFQLGLGNLGRQRDEGLADLLRTRGEIDLSYGRLGGRQAEAAAVQGLSRGGALVQAARKRAENKKFDLVPVETAETRTREGYDRGVGELSKEYSRANTDASTGRTRAQREHGQFELDVGESRFFQAAQGGYVAPTRPANERTVGGRTVRVLGRKKPVGERRYRLPSGRALSRQQFVKRAKKWKGM
jgi:hypothetical protein